MNTASRITAAPKTLLGVCLVICTVVCMPQTAHTWHTKPDNIIEKTCGDAAAARILLVYDTKHGSTAQIAEHISDVLCAEGLYVDLRFARGIDSIDDFDAVVIGSPIYYSLWRPNARRFLRRHASSLALKPVALFITLTHITDENDTPEMRTEVQRLYIDPLLKKFPGLDPIVTSGILSGSWNFEDLFPVEAFLMRLAGYEEGDYRNWTNIDAWAFELTDALSR